MKLYIARDVRLTVAEFFISSEGEKNTKRRLNCVFVFKLFLSVYLVRVLMCLDSASGFDCSGMCLDSA